MCGYSYHVCELTGLHVSSAFKGFEEGDLVSVFQVAADGNAVGNPRALDVHGLQETRNIGCGRFALHIRIGEAGGTLKLAPCKEV